MVDLCQVVKWWFEKRTEKACLWSKMSGYLNVLPSHVTLPFEYQTPKLSGIQVFGIQIVTVLVQKLIVVFEIKVK